MAESDQETTAWLAVIGRSLAALCLAKAVEAEPTKFDTILKKVSFLEGLGLSRDDAARAAGSSAGSVSTMLTREKKKSKAKNAKR